MLLGRCDFGKEDYSLNIVNLPESTPAPSQEGNIKEETAQEGNLKNPSKEGNKMGISQEGNKHTPNHLSRGEHESPLSGGDLGVGKSGRDKKPNKDNSTGKNVKQRKLFK